jgi:hypothetical protein
VEGHNERASIVSIVTQIAMKQHSRRGFFGLLGKAGAVLIGAAAGVGTAAHHSIAAGPTPNGIQCPPGCTGPCNRCASRCISGGKSCTWYCMNWIVNGQGCNPPCIEAAGDWIFNGSTCVFYCDPLQCYNC